MPNLTNTSAGRRTITLLGAAVAMACTVPAMAEPSGNAPAAHRANQDMGAMKQQMMQQMQQCMNQMPPMSGTDQTAMRAQMMERMHGCMEGMMDGSGTHHNETKEQSGPGKAEEHKPDAHDQPGKDAEPGH